MSNKACARLGREIQGLHKQLPPGVLDMHIDESNMHIIHFLIAGPPDSPYEGGQYVLKLQLSREYPHSAPDFIMYTPSGRFMPGSKICTSFSAFHPESWSPSYRIETLVISMISFMTDSTNAAGVVHTSDPEKRSHAEQSQAWNIKHRYGDMLPKVHGSPKPVQPPVATQVPVTTPRPKKIVVKRAAQPPPAARKPAPVARPHGGLDRKRGAPGVDIDDMPPNKKAAIHAVQPDAAPAAQREERRARKRAACVIDLIEGLDEKGTGPKESGRSKRQRHGAHANAVHDVHAFDVRQLDERPVQARQSFVDLAGDLAAVPAPQGHVGVCVDLT